MDTVLFLSILQKDIVNLVACLCALIEQTRVMIGTILSQYAKKTWECSEALNSSIANEIGLCLYHGLSFLLFQ